MNFIINTLYVLGGIALFFLVARIIRVFNKSKSTIDWFLYLLGKLVVVLGTLLFFDLQIFLLLIPILITWWVDYGVLSWGENHVTQSWYYFLIFLSFIYFFFCLWLTGSKKFYSLFTFLEKKKKNITIKNMSVEEENWKSIFLKTGLGFLIPLMLIVGLVMLGITSFAALTAALINSGKISFLTAIGKNGVEQVSEFYIWHFCNLIPQIHVAETLNWKVPFEYADDKNTDHGVAWLLLLFKIVMAYVVIARFYSWNKWRKESTEEKELIKERCF